MNKNVIFYVAIALAIVIVVYISLYFTFTNTYGLSMQLSQTSSTNLFPYNTTAFTVYLNNTGSNYIGSMIVGVYVNGVAFHNYNVSIPPKQTAALAVDYTYVKPGQYTFEVVADPAHVFKFVNSSSTSAGFSVVVKNATKPEPLSSLPNNGITSSSIFVFSGGLMLNSALLGSTYNISFINQIYSPTRNVLEGVVTNLYTLFNSSSGASASYSDGSSAQAVWIQGMSSQQSLLQIIRSFGFEETKLGNVTIFSLSNHSSICVYYAGGWTKIIEYTSKSLTCASIAGHTYNESEAAAFKSAFINSSEVMNYVNRFIYTNSTVFATQFSVGNRSKYIASWFLNHGNIFVSYINSSKDNIKSNTTCFGLIENESVCSIYLLPAHNTSLSKSYSLIESKELAGNYSFALYSFLNATAAATANYNAAMLIRSLDKNLVAIRWKSAFASSCAFNSTYNINCTINSFNTNNHVASVELKNTGNNDITINSASCYMPGRQQNETISKKIAPTGSIAFNVTCYTIPLPIIGIQNSYYLSLNYTVGGAHKFILGFLNTSNLV